MSERRRPAVPALVGVVPVSIAIATAAAPALGGGVDEGSTAARAGEQPSAKHAAKTVRTLPTKKKLVALTFDGGSDRGNTKKILRVLRREKATASFGLTGRWVEDNPKLTRRIAKRGYPIINHTYSHSSWTGHSAGTGFGAAERRRELTATNRLVKRVAGVRTQPWFRPPYGDYDADALRLLARRGYGYNVLWSTDSLGWMGLSRAAIVKRCLDGLRRGAIYLLHVGSQSRDGAALGRLIEELKQRGYRFATIREELPR